MKLITEYVENKLDYIVENAPSGAKNVFISGIFMQAELKNRNGRYYKKSILEAAVDKYLTEQVMGGRAVGELNHPDGPQINLDKVSHRIVNLEWNGNDVVGKALILNTPMGNIVKGLLEGGVKLGVSSRGMGTLERRGDASYVKDDFVLSTIDIVQDPSGPAAFVNGIMESVEWTCKDGIFVKSKRSEKHNETEIRKVSKRGLAEARQLEELADFLSNL
jgi:hypothetical protein